MANTGLIQGGIDPAPEKDVIDYIRSTGYDPWVKYLYIKFGKTAGRKRLQLLEAAGKVRLTGRGGNRRVTLIHHVARCRVCGCIESDCMLCVERTGEPCSWVEPDLCSACAPGDAAAVKEFKKWKKEWDKMTAE